MSANPASRFHFDPERHEYSIDGVRVPSVTEILSVVVSFEGIPEAVLANARDRGDKLAKAINLENRGVLDRSSLDAETLAGVDAWAQFLAAHEATVVESENPVYHAGLRYAGTPDCILAVGDEYWLPDVKASYAPPATVGAQTFGYVAAWCERNRMSPRKVRRFCAHIRNGRLELIPLKDPRDEAIFQSCRNIYNFLRKQR